MEPRNSDKEINTPYNSRFKKLAVQWLQEVQFPPDKPKIFATANGLLCQFWLLLKLQNFQ
jgi:hypothetical protein